MKKFASIFMALCLTMLLFSFNSVSAQETDTDATSAETTTTEAPSTTDATAESDNDKTGELESILDALNGSDDSSVVPEENVEEDYSNLFNTGSGEADNVQDFGTEDNTQPESNVENEAPTFEVDDSENAKDDTVGDNFFTEIEGSLMSNEAQLDTDDSFAVEPEDNTSNTTVIDDTNNDEYVSGGKGGKMDNTYENYGRGGGKLTPTGFSEVALFLLGILGATGYFFYRRKK